MRPPGSPQELERRRHRALALLARGDAPVDVAARVGVDRRSVRRWKAAHRAQGVRGVQAKPAPGRPPKLTARQRGQLEQLLLLVLEVLQHSRLVRLEQLQQQGLQEPEHSLKAQQELAVQQVALRL